MGRRCVILGAGLAGLSTSLHLPEDWEVEVHEKEAKVGGLARSRRVDGFVFDYTGHLLHLRDDGIKELVNRLLPDAFVECERKAAIWAHGAVVDYPFQANLHGLPPEIVAECLTGFVEALRSDDAPEEAENFHEWALRCFGAGIAKHFMHPYNSKIYACDLKDMTADWVSWSVPRPSLEQVVNGALGIKQVGMGYNPTFLYPKEGGIDCLPEALATEVRGVELESVVEAVDLERREVRLADGRVRPYDALVNTLPLREFLALSSPIPDWAAEAGQALRATQVVCFNIGVGREGLGESSWLYVPDESLPFYRVGFPSTFCPAASPPGKSSAYVECAFPSGNRVDLDELQESCLEGLRTMGVLEHGETPEVIDRFVIDPAYVLFDHHRQAVRERLLDMLMEQDVYSIGRYGVWTYSSMEDALMGGRETARILSGELDRKGQRPGDR
jgi:protoporphyrinogen oxidase